MTKDTPNIIFKCKYYKPIDKYKSGTNNKEISKRNFLSCNSSYNYVSYVDSGAEHDLPKDYTEYVGNNEKSRGIFNQNGLLTDEEKRELREQLRNTQSCIWDCVISFKEDFGQKYCRDYEQAFAFVKNELPKFFTRAGLDKDNMVWYAGLHENTENNHIHISFFEKEPVLYSKRKLVYHSGKIDKEVLQNSRFIFEKKLTNKTAEIFALRKDINEQYKKNLSPKEFSKAIKKQLLNIYKELPSEGRLSYDSENMQFLKKKVDDTTTLILYSKPEMKYHYKEFSNEILNYQVWEYKQKKKIPERYQADIILNDFMRRLGNQTIKTAIKIGKVFDEIERTQIRSYREKHYKKKQRKFMWDNLFRELEYFAKLEEIEMENFKHWCEERERYARHQEWLNSRNDRDFEM